MKGFFALNYPRWAIVNFIVLSIFGAVLRYMQLYLVPPLNYQYILHAHSHFAFSGWMFFSIALLIALLCSGGKIGSGFKIVLLLTLVSAYGMLASFSLQGYKLVSISFSTLFILVTFRFTYLVFESDRLKSRVNAIAYQLIRGSLVFLCMSALGPLSLGPLAALGLKNSPWYQNAIYFYLHCQMNGFMLLAVLGLVASVIPLKPDRKLKRWISLFIYSTIPLYFIFILWGKPGYWLATFAGTGAVLNLASWLALCFNLRSTWRDLSFLERAALIALTFKCVFQVSVCVPAIGDWTFLNRNLIIGYIHLLTLGIIIPILVGQFIRTGLLRSGKLISVINVIYIILVVFYLCLLFMQPLLALFSIIIPSYQFLLLLLCILFIPYGVLLLFKVKASPESQM